MFFLNLCMTKVFPHWQTFLIRTPFSWTGLCHDALRSGWVFLKRTQILSGVQFITHFIEIFVVETKRFVGSFVNVILMQQTCCQRSSRAAESERRALGNYFSERIYYMFLISKFRGDLDLGLCTTSVLAFGEPQRNGKIRFFLRRNMFFFGCRHAWCFCWWCICRFTNTGSPNKMNVIDFKMKSSGECLQLFVIFLFKPEHVQCCSWLIDVALVQPIAFGMSLYLNLQSQSP